MTEADRRRLRAARTFALLAALGNEGELETGEALRGQLWADWTTDDLALEQALLDTAADADLRLAEALMEVGRDHRRREWAALERLLGGCRRRGGLDERFRALEGRDLAVAGTAVLDLGWGGWGLYAVPSPRSAP